MHRTIARLVVGGFLAVVGCRQLAGIEDLVPAPADAAMPRDARSDVRHVEGSLGDRLEVDAGACGCSGCTVLVPDLNDQPLSLVVLGSYVYVLNYGPEDGQGSLQRVSTAGGKVETLEGKLNRPFSLVADGTNFYWQAEDGKGGIVVKRPIAGGAVTTLASGLPRLQSLIFGGVAGIQTNALVAVSASDVYFVGWAPGTPGGPSPLDVLSVPVAGGAVSTLIATWPGDGGLPPPPEAGVDAGFAFLAPTALATDGTSLFAATIYPQVGILRVTLSSGAAAPLIENLNNPWALLPQGNKVIFCDDAPNYRSGTLQSISKDGGPPDILLNDGPPWAIAAEGSVYYLVDVSSSIGTAAIKAYDAKTKKLTTLAGNLAAPMSLAIDSDSVYWTDAYCGALVKVAR